MVSDVSDSPITAGLNPEQQRAVEAVRGPVCILAGAGSGKTTTITRRIANQVAQGSFDPASILAVTFTDKAAGEMRARLEKLGVEGVRARTFHSAALAQLRTLADNVPQQILPSKAMALRDLANSLPKPYRFRPAGDLATEIEWAKNRRIGPDVYADRLEGHEPPIPVDLMANIYKRYERGKNDRNLIDFEDLLELTIRMFQSDEYARERFAARYLAFTVDEYQDVNLLQETLLREWLGGRDDICVVGDDYQSIYGFTGATPRHLLQMPQRYARTRVIRLESNYRSTPEVLDVANRLVPQLGGAEKVLKPTRPEGPKPQIRAHTRADAELRNLVGRIAELHDQGLAYEDMAILYRVNFRSEDYEEALTAAGIPFRVQDGAFLNRRSAREMIRTLQKSDATDVAARVLKIAQRSGYTEDVPDGVGDQELTRQNDLARFVRLAEEFDTGERTATDFVQDVQARFGQGEGRGVNLLTLHRSKGLEFEAVFLPRVEHGELPFKRARSDEMVAEERRLFYVGITRAKTHLAISWVNDGKRKASAFVGELVEAGMVGRIERSRASGGSESSEGAIAGGPLFDGLKEWRLKRSRADGVPAYVIFHDATLAEIAEREPSSAEELSMVPGVGPTKLERYADEILELVRTVHSPAASH